MMGCYERRSTRSSARSMDGHDVPRPPIDVLWMNVEFSLDRMVESLVDNVRIDPRTQYVHRVFHCSPWAQDANHTTVSFLMHRWHRTYY